MDEGACPLIPRRFGDIARSVDVNVAHSRAEHAAKVDHRCRAANRMSNAVGIRDVGAFKAELTNLAERLDDMRLSGIPLGDTHPDPTLQQEFADVAADETAAAEYRD
jgi:hypothetical protein